jgi:hypothetical protein
MDELTKDFLKDVKKNNPLNHTFKIGENSEFKVKIKPKFKINDEGDPTLMKTNLDFEFKHNIKEDDIVIDVHVNGKLFQMISGQGDDKFYARVSATKKF